MRRLLAPALAALLAACSPSPKSIAPLKYLPKDKPYSLRVLYLEDKRLPTLTPEQIMSLHRKTETLLLEWYGYRVKIENLGRKDIRTFFGTFEKSSATPSNTTIPIASTPLPWDSTTFHGTRPSAPKALARSGTASSSTIDREEDQTRLMAPRTFWGRQAGMRRPRSWNSSTSPSMRWGIS